MHLLSTSALGAVLCAAGSANANFAWGGWGVKPAAAVPYAGAPAQKVATWGPNGAPYNSWAAPSSWWPAKTANGWGAPVAAVNSGRAVGQKDCPQGHAAWRVGCRKIPACTTGRVWKGWNQGCCEETCPRGRVFDYRVGDCNSKPKCAAGQVWNGWARGCCAKDENTNTKPDQVCPAGQYWDAAYSQCCDVKTRAPIGSNTKPDQVCPAGQYWDAAYSQCCDVKTRAPVGSNTKPDQVCPAGQYWDAAYSQCCDVKTRAPVVGSTVEGSVAAAQPLVVSMVGDSLALDENGNEVVAADDAVIVDSQ